MVKAVFRILIPIGYILILVHCVVSNVPTSKDVHDAEINLKADLLKNYSSDVIPVENHTSPVVVDIDLIIILIKELDAKTQTLTTEAFLKMRWHDYRLAWKPKDYAGLNLIPFALDKIWQPDIELYSSTMVEKIQKTKVFAVLHSDGKVIWQPPVTVHTVCTVDLKYYPYDKHTCPFKFGSWTYDGYKIDLEIFDQKEIMTFAEVWNDSGEWKITNGTVKKVVTKYTCCEEPYPDVIFKVTLQRRSPFYKVIIGCPLVGAIIFMLASFWVPPTADSRIILNIVPFLTILLLLIHLSATLQTSGKTCPLIITLCGIMLQIFAVTIVISVAFAAVAHSKRDDPIPEWIYKIVQTPCMKYIGIDTSMQDAASGSKEGYFMNLSPEDESKNSSTTTPSKPNHWAMFLQIIDRLFFVLLVIIIIFVGNVFLKHS